jgi:hypothetical protein
MLVGVALLPPSLIPTLWNIGILLHKQAKLRKDTKIRNTVLINSTFQRSMVHVVPMNIAANGQHPIVQVLDFALKRKSME